MSAVSGTRLSTSSMSYVASSSNSVGSYQGIPCTTSCVRMSIPYPFCTHLRALSGKSCRCCQAVPSLTDRPRTTTTTSPMMAMMAAMRKGMVRILLNRRGVMKVTRETMETGGMARTVMATQLMTDRMQIVSILATPLTAKPTLVLRPAAQLQTTAPGMLVLQTPWTPPAMMVTMTLRVTLVVRARSAKARPKDCRPRTTAPAMPTLPLRPSVKTERK